MQTDTKPQEEIVERIRKLLALAAKNTNANEAAAATAKAQALLTQYNLDASLIETAQGRADGKREEAKMEGGFYLYQRELYKAIAELNFCMYFTEEYATERTKTIKRRNKRRRYDYESGEYKHVERVYAKGDTVIKKRHRIIGKQVNTATTRVMCFYVEETIERLIRERLARPDGSTDFGQLYSNWGISFREGAVEVVVEKAEKERQRQITAEKARQRSEAKMAAQGASSGSSLTISDVMKTEEAGNYDFVYGQGSWAAKLEREAASAKRWKNELARRAKLAKDNPEAAKKEEEERRKSNRSGGWGRSPKERSKDWGAFKAGNEAGANISLHRQTGDKSVKGLLK